MSNLPALKNIAGVLNTKEILLVKRLLQLRENISQDGGNIKTYQLFELALKNPSLTETEIETTIYHKKVTKGTLRELISRLLSKIQEALTLNVSLYRQEAHSPYWIALLDIEKKMLYAHILRIKGLYEEVLELYDLIIEKAKKFEHYDELVKALRYKQAALIFLHDKKGINEMEKQIDFYERCRLGKYKAMSWYFKLGDEEAKSHQGYVSKLGQAIEEINQEAIGTQSDNINYYLQSLKTDYFLHKKEYGHAYSCAEQLISLLLTKPSIYFRPRMGYAYMLMADIELFRDNFSHAADLASIAQSFFPQKNANYSLSLETEFYARFYNGEMEKAEQLITTILYDKHLTVTPSVFSKRNYLMGCVLLLQKKYKEAHRTLRQTKDFSKEQQAWKAGVRLMTIMEHLECGEYDHAENEIINYRGYFYNHRSKQPLNKRQELIVKLLVGLKDAGFNFKKVWSNREKDFTLLASSQPDYQWEAKSPEMIIFHQWFKSKALKVPYTVSINGQDKQAIPVKQEARF